MEVKPVWVRTKFLRCVMLLIVQLMQTTSTQHSAPPTTNNLSRDGIYNGSHKNFIIMVNMNQCAINKCKFIFYNYYMNGFANFVEMLNDNGGIGVSSAL